MTPAAGLRVLSAACLSAVLLSGCGSAAEDAHSIGDKASQGAQDTGNAVKKAGDAAGDAVGGH